MIDYIRTDVGERLVGGIHRVHFTELNLVGDEAPGEIIDGLVRRGPIGVGVPRWIILAERLRDEGKVSPGRERRFLDLLEGEGEQQPVGPTGLRTKRQTLLGEVRD